MTADKSGAEKNATVTDRRYRRTADPSPQSSPRAAAMQKTTSITRGASFPSPFFRRERARVRVAIQP